jgi:hypothetical protein
MERIQTLVLELNKEKCAVHNKQGRCRISLEGIEYNACCKNFRIQLSDKLNGLVKPHILHADKVAC